MDIRKIKKLIELLEESGLAELEIKEKDEAVRLSRYSKHAAPVAAPVAAPGVAPPVAAAAPVVAAEPAPAPETPVAEGNVIRAPMVGTFYASPSPESEPFVQVGSSVEVGDAICIIEAMKMFNTIESEYTGKVVSVLAESGQPVEYNQPLFVIR